MPETREGLEESVEGFNDPNTDVGFLAALAKQADVAVPDEEYERVVESDRSVASGLEEESGQPRDDRGRFTSRETAAASEEAGAAPAAEETREEQDPWANVDPTLKAEFEALKQEKENRESLIGRQGTELGELRERLAKMEGRFEAQSAQPSAPAPVVTTSDVERVENMVAERGGQYAMNWAANNAPHLIDATLEAWALEEPVAAARFAVRYEHALLQNQAKGEEKTETAPALDPDLAQLAEDARMARAVGAIKQEIGDARFTAASAHLVATMQDAATPEFIKKAAASTDEKTRLEGMKALFALAEGRALREVGGKATSEADEKRKQEEEAAKKAARVASGSLRPVEQRQPAGGGNVADDMTREERLDAFYTALRATETTSVHDGLVYGKS